MSTSIIEVIGPMQKKWHLVPGGTDRNGMPWLYQNTLCGVRAPELGWFAPDHFPGAHAAPQCTKCLMKTSYGRTIYEPGDTIVTEGELHPTCDDNGRSSLAFPEYANDFMHDLYVLLDETLSRPHIWDHTIRARITVEILSVEEKTYERPARTLRTRARTVEPWPTDTDTDTHSDES